MPTYEYECGACEHAFEEYQSMTDSKLRKCPECGKFKLQRLIGAGGGIIFKGSGFYATDYKSKSSAESPPADKKASTTTAVKEKKDTSATKTESTVKDA